MKKTMIIAIAMASITAAAQTSATTAPQGAAQTSEVASAEVQATPATTAGTSAVDASAQAAPKKWSAKAQLYSTTDSTNTQKIQNLTTFSGSYKVLSNLSLRAGQTFETLTNGKGTAEATRELTKRSNFRTSYTDVGVSTSLPGFAGSEKLGLSVNLRLMGGDSEYTTTGGYGSAYNLVDTNFSIPFTLSPKWSLSIDSQWRTVDNKPKWKVHDDMRVEDISQNSNRFLVIPSITYTINDYVSIYHAAGWIGSFKDAEALRRNYERFYMETGVTVTPIKNLAMTFMVDQDKAIYASPSSGVDVTGYSLYKPTAASNANSTLDAVAYEAIIAYTF